MARWNSTHNSRISATPTDGFSSRSSLLSMAKTTHLIIVSNLLGALVLLQNRLRNLVGVQVVLAVLDLLPQRFDSVLPDTGRFHGLGRERGDTQRIRRQAGLVLNVRRTGRLAARFAGLSLTFYPVHQYVV